MKFLLFVVLFSSLAATAGWAQDPSAELAARAVANKERFYDEIFDGSGRVRPHYRDLWEIYRRIKPESKEKFREKSLADFQADNALSTMPKVLTQGEYDELKRGTEQRGKAALLFLRDLYSGERRIVRDGVIPGMVLERVLTRTREWDYEKHLKARAADLAFPYGSDLIRAADGKYYEIEFNSGFVGGFGDLNIARRSLLERVPEYQKPLADTPDPADYYRDALAHYRSQMKNPDDLVIFATVPPYADNEDKRLIDIWRELGVHAVNAGDDQKLVNRADGLYLELDWKSAQARGLLAADAKRPRGGIFRKRVGFAIVNSEFDMLAPRHAMNLEDRLMTLAPFALRTWKPWTKEGRKAVRDAMKPDPKTGHIDVDRLFKALNPQEFVLNGGLPGILDAYVDGKLPLNFTPGTSVLSDKEFHTYMEDVIRYYLNEEPIVKNLPTQRLYALVDGKPAVDEKLLRDTLENFDRYVVKVVDGRGGKGVWVGPKTSPEERAKLVKLIRAEPDRFIRQEFNHLSVMDGDITDLRMLAQVGPLSRGADPVLVSKTPWARALPIEGDGKVNLSSSGHEMAVFVRPDGSYPQRARRPTPVKGRECEIWFGEALSKMY